MANNEDNIEDMRRRVAAHDAAQAEARARDDATRAVAESEAVKPLIDFVESKAFSGFVERANEISGKLTGQPLIQHLVGAMTSLSVVQTQVAEAKARYESAAATLAGEGPRAEPVSA